MLTFEQHASPIVTEFLDGICVPPPVHGVENARKLVNAGQLGGAYALKVQAAETAMAKKCSMQIKEPDMNDMGLDIDGISMTGDSAVTECNLDALTEEDVAAVRPFYVARNRFP